MVQRRGTLTFPYFDGLTALNGSWGGEVLVLTSHRIRLEYAYSCDGDPQAPLAPSPSSSGHAQLMR